MATEYSPLWAYTPGSTDGVQWSKHLLRIFGPKLIHKFINENQAKCGFKNRTECGFENVTLVARRREHLWGFMAIFFVAELPQKKRCFNTQEFTRVLSTVWIRTHFQYQWISKPTRHWNHMPHRQDFIMKIKIRCRQDFFVMKMRRRQNWCKKMFFVMIFFWLNPDGYSVLLI